MRNLTQTIIIRAVPQKIQDIFFQFSKKARRDTQHPSLLIAPLLRTNRNYFWAYWQNTYLQASQWNWNFVLGPLQITKSTTLNKLKFCAQTQNATWLCGWEKALYLHCKTVFIIIWFFFPNYFDNSILNRSFELFQQSH